jgi:phosphinothricin acetyltransferase
VLVYVAPGHQGQGIGASLLGALLELGNAAGISRFYASVFTGNAPSVRLHRRFGFAEVRIEPRPEDFEGNWLETRLLVRETGTGRAP